MSNIPAHLLTPRDWQAEAVAHAARECGTPEGRRALAEATRYGALADRLADLQAALDAEHAQRIALQHHAADQARRVADLEALVADLLAALNAMLAIHEQPSGFAGKYGKALTEAIASQQTRIDSAVGMARDAIARAEGGAA